MFLENLLQGFHSRARKTITAEKNNKKIKIIVVSDRVYPFFKGGAEKRYWEISKQLTRSGYEVCYLTGQWPEMPKRVTINGIKLVGVYKVGGFYRNGRKSISETGV